LNKKKAWVILGGGLLAVLSFLISDSVRQTISRRRAIRAAEIELSRLTQETDQAHKKINSLETDPKATEQLVRKELGYLKPDEKEARFK
jgi:cell division protein FtsB